MAVAKAFLDAVKKGLDVTTAGRLSRAKDQGFDPGNELFHWTNRTDIEEFIPSERGKLGPGIYTSNKPNYGRKYVEDDKATLMKMYPRGEIATLDDWAEAERKLRANGALPDDTKARKAALQEQMKQDGFSGLRVQDETLIFDPQDVRSTNAMFDPDNKTSKKILASAAGAAAVYPQDDAEAAFGGVLAKNADHFMRSVATKMKDAGRPRDEIWQKTGWDLDAVDGKPRFEIDDSGAKPFPFTDQESERLYPDGILFGDVNDRYLHKELAAQYPDLMETDLVVQPKMQGGSYSAGIKGDDQFLGTTPEIYAGTSGNGVNQSVLAHELQHGIQHKEGFAQGGNPKEFIEDALGSKRIAESEIAAINAQLHDVVKQKDGWLAKLPELSGDAKNIVTNRISELDNTYSELLSARSKYVPDAQIDPSEHGFGQYKRLAGETEARNVQSRLNMTAQERRASPPWETADVPESEQIVRGQTGSADPRLLAGLAAGAAMFPEDSEAGPLAKGAMRLLDDRFLSALGGGNPRVGLRDTVAGMETAITPRELNVPGTNSLYDFEGSPYILTQSDRSAAGGTLDAIHGTQIDPVDLRGGRDFMFDPPSEGQVWASDPRVVRGLQNRGRMLKEQHGQSPLLLPYSMAPTGIDFATMPLDTMLGYARQKMSKANLKKLNKKIKNIVPDWGGIEDPASSAVFRNAQGPQRKAVADLIDKEFRDVPGGLSISEARAATSDAAQYMSPEGQVTNIGRIDTGSPLFRDSGHPTYIGGLPGEGVGILDNPVDVRPFMAKNGRQLTGDAADIRALSMNHGLSQGVIDEPLLRSIYGKADPRLLGGIAGATGAAAALPFTVDQYDQIPVGDQKVTEIMAGPTPYSSSMAPPAMNMGAEPDEDTREAARNALYGTIAPPEHPWVLGASNALKGLNKRLEGSPMELFAPDATAEWLGKMAYGQEPTWEDRLGVLFDWMP